MTSSTDTILLLAFIKKVAARVEETMRTDLDQALVGNDPLLSKVLQYALLTGGKRIRPMLAVVSARLCGRDDDELYLLAAAFEYLHVATLIHDDVIDNAESRRGVAAVGKKFGVAAAILAGDWLHARSMHLISTLAGQQGLDIFCDATMAMVDGEFLQLRYVADTAVTEEQYYAVIIRKTASLISSTCEIGALFGGGTVDQVAALAIYGKKIGIGFQIIDDLLDYLGNEQTTGKQVGNDLTEGKLTLPLIHALSQAREQDRDILLNCIRGGCSPAGSCDTAQQLMHNLGSYAFSRQRAAQEVKEGLATLTIFDRDRHKESLAILQGLAGYILTRDR